MSLQATEATVVTLGEDNSIIRWVIFIQSAWSIYVNLCHTHQTPIVYVTLDLMKTGIDMHNKIPPSIQSCTPGI